MPNHESHPNLTRYHYWLGINAGNGNEATTVENHFYKTSGRAPHIGGDGTRTIHLYNNVRVSLST
ncbi:putative pectin lyase precursor [Moniliophthora roreri MCA 2997]|uniref:Pectin lyase n=2 Tax=Moniliophthora roreri TaxID=221103 RepID=V2XG07_MONRO|nr:putative pectin lyase precursor [Moniliophthora roreri MCA 2997]